VQSCAELGVPAALDIFPERARLSVHSLPASQRNSETLLVWRKGGGSQRTWPHWPVSLSPTAVDRLPYEVARERHAAGGRPTCFLNARLKAATLS
jgi:hypothetical protein